MNAFDENLFQDDDELAIFEVLFDYLKRELEVIHAANNNKRMSSGEVIRRRKKLLCDLLNLGDECKLNDLLVNNVSFCCCFLNKENFKLKNKNFLVPV